MIFLTIHAEIASSGKSGFIHSKSNVTNIHQVTAASLYTLLHQPYQEDLSTRVGGEQGCSILVHSRIPSTLVLDPASCGEGVEVMAVSLTLQNTSLQVYNVYKSSNSQLNLEEVFEQAVMTPTFIGGDFNCHHPILHSPRTTNRDGRHLAAAIL